MSETILDYAITTLVRVKSYLGITNTAKDDLLTLLINAVTDYMENYCGRRFAQTTYTNQEFDGSGKKQAELPQWPVIIFTQLQLNNNADNSDDWETIDSNKYWVDTDTGIIQKTTFFIKGKNRYRATYSAGYATIPYDLQLAAIIFVAGVFNKRNAIGIKSESLGDHSIDFEQIMMDNPTVKATMDRYRRYVIADEAEEVAALDDDDI